MIENGQTSLEKYGIEERKNTIIRNDYSITDEYSDLHADAISDGDVKGKGTKSGGHGVWLPDHSKPRSIDYSNFNTTQGGGLYDIEGRNDIGGRKKAIASSLYNEEHQYGLHLIDTTKNVRDGQVQL